jgi:hypothetical protein
MKSLKFCLVLLCLAMSTILQAQNIWYCTQDVKEERNMETDCPFYMQADPQIEFEWQYVIGSPDSMNLALDIVFDKDSNLVYLYKDFWQNTYFLICMEQTGEELWRTSIFSDDSIGFGLKITPLGTDFYISGYWDIENLRHFGIAKINNHGKQLWVKDLFETKNDLKKTRDFNPNLITVENNNLLGTFIDKDSAYIVKIDSAAKILWNKNIDELGLNYTFYVFDIIYNNKYKIFLNKYSICHIVELTLDSDVMTIKELSGYNYNATFLKSYYFSGHDGDHNNYIRKYDAEFDLVYEYKTGDDGINLYDAATISILSDESLLVFYEYEYPGFDYNIYYDFNVLHLDKNGQCQSTLYLSAAGSQYAVKMLTTKNGDCILYGYGYNSYYNQDMVALVKVKQWDPVGINDKNQTLRNMEIWPTPAHNNLQIKFSNHTVCTLKLYALTGKLLAQYRITDETTTIDISGLVPGIYIISTSDGEDKQFQRFAKY